MSAVVVDLVGVRGSGARGRGVTSLRARAASGRAGARQPGAGALRLTRRGRFVVLLVALLVVAVPVVVHMRAAAAESPVSAVQVERHVVEPGETLWQIASPLTRPGEDVRDVVRELILLNDLPSSALLAGQAIVVPVAS